MHTALHKQTHTSPSATYVFADADERAMVMACPQIVRKANIAMKRIITAIAYTLASLVVVAGATAQQPAVRAVIPFDFNASGNELPAGTYTIATRNGFTVITKDSSGESAVLRVIPFIDNLPDDSKLLFSTYGDQHFLRKILCPGLHMSLELVPSEPEIRARMQTASNPGD